MPKVSIIVPVYKAEKYLHRCVDSILAQTFRDWECILVDDGSPDGSGAICDEYAQRDARIRVIHKENGGVSSARNTGIDKSNGELICFVDSDDFINNDYLICFLKKYTPDVDIVMCGHINHYEILNTMSIETFPPENGLFTTEDIIYESEVRNIINSPVCKLFRASIIRDNNLKFDCLTNYGEDHLFVLDYCRYINRVDYISDAAYHYIHHAGESLTQQVTNSDRYVYYFTQLVYKYNQLINEKKWNSLSKKISKVISSHATMAIISIFNENRSKAIRRNNFNLVYRSLGKYKSLSVDYMFQKLIIFSFYFSAVVCYSLCCYLCKSRSFLLKLKNE